MSDYITERKNEYNFHLSQSLNNPATSSKTYWTILKTFYSGKKIPLIPPLVINDQLITDFWKKANCFNLYFARQCTSIEDDSSIPTETNCLCDATISAVDFEEQDILKIILALDINNKAHGHDNILTRMIKNCDSSIAKTLSIIYRNSLNSGIFPDNWKRPHVVPVHKKGNKQLIQNYDPVSLFPISTKIFERLIFNLPYKVVEENSLLCSNQSGFTKTDSCVNQLLSILHKIYESFDNFPSLQTHLEFLDMSKAFDRVWYEGLLYRLKAIGVSNNLPTLFQSFLNNRYQRVLFNGQNSHWELIKADVPQGSF